MQRDQDHLSQEENLDRVTEKISAAVVQFCELEPEKREKEFHMAELTQFVSERVGPSAPDTPGRVLRLLRQSGKIAYSVVSRRNSVYRIIRPKPCRDGFPERGRLYLRRRTEWLTTRGSAPLWRIIRRR